MTLAVLAFLLAAQQPAVSDTDALRHGRLAAAPAVWRVDFSIRAEGTFPRVTGDEVVGADTIAKMDIGFGSATAVSADGYLLTNRHVVDPGEVAEDACTKLRETYREPVMKALRVEYLFTDLGGTPVHGRAEVRPQEADADICANTGAITWTTDDVFPMRIVKLDAVADLALVKLGVQGIPFLAFADTEAKFPDPVTSFGYNEHWKLMAAGGMFHTACEQVTVDTEKKLEDVVVKQAMNLAHVRAPMRQGMSGGPLILGERLAGINAVVQMACSECDEEDCDDTGEDGWVVPGAYARDWFLWATGKAAKPPEVCTPVPDGPPSSPSFDPFARKEKR